MWIEHFKENAQKKRINWNLQPELPNEVKKKILSSLKAWQKGETSDGANLTRAARKHAIKIGDMAYLKAIELFIKEEQKHGESLGIYIDRLGEKRVQFNLGDHLFRKVRYLANNMEIWTITVIIVESYAQIFYKALHDCSSCTLLQQICTDILKDEAHHIRFQIERLQQILHNRSRLRLQLTKNLYYLHFLVISHTIWLAHKTAFKAGGVTRKIYWKKAKSKFKSICNHVFSSTNYSPSINPQKAVFLEN